MSDTASETVADDSRETPVLPRHEMTPREIVAELDRHIIGQGEAKRSVAIALRNRWRRMQLDPELMAEISPKNILMIGPTGVGKTEIARRLARLAGAPFIKIEATKFTEVGYVGRDVESIIRDLMEVAIKLLREKEMARVRHKAEDAAEDRVLDALLPNARGEQADNDSNTRQIFRKKLREGELDDKEIEIEIIDDSANRIFMVGEFSKQTALPYSTGGMSLSDAMADAGGVNLGSANTSAIYVVRGFVDSQPARDGGVKTVLRPNIYKLDASDVSGLLLANQFELKPRDVVFAAPASLVNFNRALALILPSLNAFTQSYYLYDRIGDDNN